MRDCSVEKLLESLGDPAADRDYRPGHGRVAAMLTGRRLQRPRLRIRVAGTNGKGSTATMVAAGLQAAGLRVGLYTSPHLHHFHERISIDGVAIDDQLLRAELMRLLPIAIKEGGSYFEVATVAALSLFSDAGVDAEVLEAGVGARLDATTAVDADMALLTPVALDHQQWLGDSLCAVAAEKGEVASGCRWFLSAQQPDVVRTVLRDHYPSVRWVPHDPLLGCAMAGLHQQQNGALALAALDQLRQADVISADEELLRGAVVSVRLAGRLQCYRLNGSSIWLDVAHNAHAVASVVRALPNPLDAILIYTRDDRSLTDQQPLLSQAGSRLIGRERGVWGESHPTVEAALDHLLINGIPSRVAVLGSFVTVAAAQKWLIENGGESVE
ncbi:MAG: Mur ligase family protein [Mariprofundales bacterium]|nr:Mur ligase family protein [Mariprofundales bacterium]